MHSVLSDDSCPTYRQSSQIMRWSCNSMYTSQLNRSCSVSSQNLQVRIFKGGILLLLKWVLDILLRWKTLDIMKDVMVMIQFTQEGKLFVAVDGNMQLRRRKAHANDTKKAEAATFFSADKMHDVYEKHEVTNAVNKRCESELKAVTSVSAAVEKFYESGIVGCVCGRHNVPLQFTNIFASGEK
ncbi:hypothetical protein BDB00DRAFT_522360 [Zychaea mexicana]|uniref:uncharacterized protein n=1 Tax=Zychaea mexicana TaxID=64656 RepID=UPI0022FE7342|nr:uncharacterized protein BDB00DRAFT_522360 [Zychaea mexicana]KAI9490979.1 hypothetical protein BDB00DRAFT_522360 [Zychaea mexicana]